MSFSTASLRSAAVALGTCLAALAGPALANGTSDHVYSIDLQRDGIDGFVTIRNVSANKHVSALKIEPTKSSFSLSMAGWVSCEKPPAFAESLLVQDGTRMYFGTIGLGHGKVWEQQVLHEDTGAEEARERGREVVRAHGRARAETDRSDL